MRRLPPNDGTLPHSLRDPERMATDVKAPVVNDLQAEIAEWIEAFDQ